MKKVDVKGISYPVAEVVVRVGEMEVLVVAFFEDGSGGFDVLVGIEDHSSREDLATTLDSAAVALREASFDPVSPDASSNELPF